MEQPSLTPNENRDGPRKRICERISNQFIICIVVSFVALLAAYAANGIFLWTVMRDNRWKAFLEHDIMHFKEIRDYVNYKAPLRELMEDLERISLNPPRRPKGAPPSELQIQIERSNKTEEMMFTWTAMLVLIGGHFTFMLPFCVRLRAKYRSWYLYLAIVYGLLALLCLIGASAEIASVVYTDRAYTSFEDLALNGSTGAMMLASCQIRKNEFRKNLTKNPVLVKFRDRHHVCQDAWWKLGASILLFLVLILYLSIGIVLFHHFSYLISNNIYPRSQLEAENQVTRREQVVAQIWFNIKRDDENNESRERKGSRRKSRIKEDAFFSSQQQKRKK